MATIAEILSQELGQKLSYVENVIALMDEGNTIPFIARYRKEMHGAMDDTVLRTLETRLTYLRNLQTRRDEVKKSIENQGKLTEELSAAIDAAATLAEVEDLYRPYRPKRRTRATIAKEKGLEPLADLIALQMTKEPLEKTAENFAARMELPVVHNRCPVDKHTKREEIKTLVYDLSQTYPDLKERIFGAMQRLPLPEWEPHGRYKRPKEQE